MNQYAYGGRVVCKYSQSCSLSCGANVSHCRTQLMLEVEERQPRGAPAAQPQATGVAEAYCILHEKSWHRGASSCSLVEDVSTCLKDAAQHSATTLLVPFRPHCRHRVFKGAHCRRHRKNIARLPNFLLDFGLRLMLPKRLTICVNTIALSKRFIFMITIKLSLFLIS